MTKFTCTIPNLERFEVRTTVPLPPGQRFSKRSCPYTIVDPNGNELPSQCEIVTRDGGGDVSVVQVLAICQRGQFEPGSRQAFTVIRKSQESVWWGGSGFWDDLLTTEKLSLRAKDAVGNIYEGPINIGAGSRILSLGQVRAVAETAGVLNPNGSSAIAHLGAFQAIVSGRNDRTLVIELTLSWHNGLVDFPISDIYFQTLELVMPGYWRIRSEWPEPLMGEGREEGTSWVVPLITPMPDGKCHLMQQKDARDWRLLLYLKGTGEWADEIATQTGWGACDAWQSSENSGYSPQHVVVPKLSHIPNALATAVISKKDSMYHELATGLPYSNGGGGLGQLGYRNPAGVAYGGMTGGVEIHEFEGIDTLAASRSEGLLFHRALSRRYADRMRGGFLYEEDGRPIELDNYLGDDGIAPWRMFNSEFQPKNWPNRHLDDDEPFNFDAVDNYLVEYVDQHDLRPWYDQTIRQYAPIDDQHFIRRSKDLRVLIWLDNDHLSKRHVLMHAETQRMTYLETPGGRFQGLLESVTANPGKGGPWGRAEAHTLDTAVTAFAVADDTWRTRWDAWFSTVTDIVLKMQGSNGIWDRHFDGKVITSFDFDGKYSAMRPNEHELMIHAVRGLMLSVLFGRDVRVATMYRAYSKGLLGVWTFLWKRDPAPGNGWWDTVAVGSLDPEEEMWNSSNQHPPEQYVVPVDGHHTPVVLGYALEAFGESAVTPGLSLHFGTQDVRAKLQEEGLKNLTNRSHLIALLLNNEH